MAFAYMQDPGWQYLRQTDEKRLQDQSKPYDSKKDCWVPDAEEGYVAGVITGTKGDESTIQTAKGNTITMKTELVQEMNPPKFEKAEDMSNLSFLNDASVLNNLRSRYQEMLIYTYSGLFCVVINPYKRLPIYTESVAQMYMGKRKNEMPPHLFANSDEAYRNMLQDHENQSMLITGESGAGKTENTKKVISYFAAVGASQSKPKAPEPGVKKVTLEDQIVQTNPVLEAFGNAKTVRNNNSSRFGKFIRIHFSKSGKVAGCDIEHYLLEKSRVVRQAPGERCYHIFYQIYTSPDLRGKLKLDKPIAEYNSVNQAELTIKGVDDDEEFQMTDEAFDILMFSAEEKLNCYRLMSGIMHMYMMKFKQKPREEQAEADGDDEAKLCADMLGVDYEALLTSLLKPKVKVGKEWVNKGQNLEQVHWAIGAMSRGCYDRVFNWLVEMCNKTLDARELERVHFIGVLDIAGFEIFDFNSFEQIWINFVNEKLQQFFNHHMFVLEQEEYKREGINWVFIDFGLDLAACIELIEKPMGIISMLDEECIVPKATDLTYAQKLLDAYVGKHPAMQKAKPPKGKQAEAHFALGHYAGLVRYNVTNWLEKNKDPLNDTCVSVMKQNKDNALLLTIWENYTTQEEIAKKEAAGGGPTARKKGKSASMSSVSMKYRESLNKLMTMLNATHPHFVRCLIPNEVKQSGLLDAGLAMNQLTCNGVLEGIRICRKGFPNRTLHIDFKQRYSILAGEAAASSTDPMAISQAILSTIVSRGDLTDENFRVGKTKVFFKAGILATMEDLRDQRLSALMIGLQSAARWYTALIEKKRRWESITGMRILQKNIQSWCTLREWDWFKLFGGVQPMIKAAKEAEELARMEEIITGLEDNLMKEEKLRKELEESKVKLSEEKAALKKRLETERGGLADAEERIETMGKQNDDMRKENNRMVDKLHSQESKYQDMQKGKKKAENDSENLKRSIQDLEMGLKKAEGEKQGKDNQIRSLEDEMKQQEEAIAKLNKERKHQEDMNKKTSDDLTAEEEKVMHMNKLKSKLESQLDEIEDALEREKRAKLDVDKAKRKMEGELKVQIENNNETLAQKSDIDNNLRKKENELAQATERLEDTQNNVNKLQKQIKDLQNRVGEVEEELEIEKNSRAKCERAKADLERELEEMTERLDEAGGATSAQVELNKKREAELSKLRRSLEEANMTHENTLANLRKKHNDAVVEMGDQLDQIAKQKARGEKEKTSLQRDLEDLQAAADAEAKSKTNAEKMVKQLEIQMGELQSKTDEQTRQIIDYTNVKARLNNENSDLGRQLEEVEANNDALQRLKSALMTQLEDAKRLGDEEARERIQLSASLRNLQHETDILRDQLEQEAEGKNDLTRQLTKAHAEAQQWRSRFENEGLVKMEEIEEQKRRLNARIVELQEILDQTNIKHNSLDKMKLKLMGELDDAQVDVERANNYASQLEKKQKALDKIAEEWKKKCDDCAAELDGVQRDSRNMATELFKSKTACDEMHETVESLRRENKNLSGEIKDLTDQLGEGGRAVHEMQKQVRRLELEKDEFQHALDEAEAALEAEESKVMRAQVEVSQIRSEIEKRIQEKEEEFESTRKNHQRAIDSMQATLESEGKSKAELMRVKKKLEQDINELEMSLDQANKTNAEAQNTIKRCLDQIRDLQQAIEEEQRARDEARDMLSNTERRCAALQMEKEEFMNHLSQAERQARLAQAEAQEAREQLNAATLEHNNLQGQKRKIEVEAQNVQHDIDETTNEVHASEDRCRKAMADAARLAGELRQEQEHSMQVERLRKGLEQTVKELQVRLDEAEQAALKGGKRMIAKLEQRARQLESELDGESRRHQEALKNMGKAERKVREQEFSLEEEKKNQMRMQDLVEKLSAKIKAYKRQVEEAEEQANQNLQKYRQLQHMLADAEERADMAENSLSKLRARHRSSGIGLMNSASAVALTRSASRIRGNPTSTEDF